MGDPAGLVALTTRGGVQGLWDPIERSQASEVAIFVVLTFDQ